LLVLFTSLQNIAILSIVMVRAGVKSTNVVCPHNGFETVVSYHRYYVVHKDRRIIDLLEKLVHKLNEVFLLLI